MSGILSNVMNINESSFNDSFTQRRGKNKVDIISPVSLLQLKSVIVHNNPNPTLCLDHEDKTEKVSPSFVLQSKQFELLLLKFFKISYFTGINPYYVNVQVSKNGRFKVETVPSGKLHTVVHANMFQYLSIFME